MSRPNINWFAFVLARPSMLRDMDDFPIMRSIGDTCLLVEFGQGVDPDIHRRAVAFAQRLRAAALPGIDDIVPSFTTVGLHFRPEALRTLPGQTPLAAVEAAARALLEAANAAPLPEAREIEIPVCYGGDWGPDLGEVARRAGVAPEEIVRLHAQAPRSVFMVGFAPGHPYIGLWGEAFDLPRRATPRARVPAGTVGVANRQCVIYPFELPSGWNLIGRTPLRLFDPAAGEPCLLAPGDLVRFVPVGREDFERLREQPDA